MPKSIVVESTYGPIWDQLLVELLGDHPMAVEPVMSNTPRFSRRKAVWRPFFANDAWDGQHVRDFDPVPEPTWPSEIVTDETIHEAIAVVNEIMAALTIVADDDVDETTKETNDE
jgi:hypothetical protein